MALNVLVVDDSSIMRAMIIRTLHMSGVPVGEVYQAGNGVDGLKILNENWVDLAMVDINMPIMNGEEMIDRLRRNAETADLPVLVVSTERSETRVQSLQAKGVTFVHKPFTPEGLKETIVRLTGAIDEGRSGGELIQGCGPDF